RRGSTEVGTTVVGGILLFVGREVTQVRLHLSHVSLVLRIGKLRNRNRGKNADDHDDDKKLDKSETLFIVHENLRNQLLTARAAAVITKPRRIALPRCPIWHA